MSTQPHGTMWGGAGTGQCPVDGLAATLIGPDGSPRKDVAVLYGYLWRGTINGATRVRLYLTWLMDDYVELDNATILYWRKVPYDGGTLVWVERDVALRHVRHGGKKEKAYEIFMAGQISAGHLAGAPVGASPWGTSEGAAPFTALCGYTINCQSP